MLTYLLIQRALPLAISHMYTSSRPVVHVKARFCISLSDSTTSASQLEQEAQLSPRDRAMRRVN